MKEESKTVIKNLTVNILIILAGAILVYQTMNNLVPVIIYVVTVVWLLFVVYVIFPILSQI